MKKTTVHHRLAIACAALIMTALPLSASACAEDALTGSICAVPMDWCPRGFAKADGSVLPISGNEALFSLIGNIYGGTAGQSFGLPDLRGRSVIGTGAGAGANPALAAVSLGAKVGAQVTTLSQLQMPTHTHGATFAPTMGQSQVTIPAQSSTLNVKADLPVSPTTTGALSGNTVALTSGTTGYLSGIKGFVNADDVSFTGPYTSTDPGSTAALLPTRTQVTGNAGTAQANVNINTVTGGTVNVLAAGASQPVTIQSPALALTYCISTSGIYPSRPD